jgi:hypothetical protein
MITLCKRGSPRDRRRSLTGVVVVVAALGLAPAASADGWSLVPVQTQSNWAASALSGVSCPYGGTTSTKSPCIGVGYDQVIGDTPSALIEYWDGSAWSVWQASGPGGSNRSELYSVSCPSTTFCTAVGFYVPNSTGVMTPLVYTLRGGNWVQQTVNGASGDLDSVSCQSSTFCVAVGESAVVWNGSNFSVESAPVGGPAPLSLAGVSCAAATSGFCLAVGYIRSGGVTRPYAEAYESGQWVVQTNLGGPFPVEPGTTEPAFLTGVYCVTAQDCQVVGEYSAGNDGIATNEVWGAELNGSVWSLSSLPPSGVGASFGAVTCPQECWTVGGFDSSHGREAFADNQAGTTWGFASLPTPGGLSSGLGAVSCALINYCLAVGTTRNPAGTGTGAFAERYLYTIPTPGGGGRTCVSLNCLPPPPGTPHHFALTASGTERHGATVIAVLHKPRKLVLLVEGVRRHRRVIVGEVPLGSHPIGTSRIHWNLWVDRHVLAPGTYEVSLHSISVDVLSPATAPGAITLTVGANRQVHVSRPTPHGGLP